MLTCVANHLWNIVHPLSIAHSISQWNKIQFFYKNWHMIDKNWSRYLLIENNYFFFFSYFLNFVLPMSIYLVMKWASDKLLWLQNWQNTKIDLFNNGYIQVAVHLDRPSSTRTKILAFITIVWLIPNIDQNFFLIIIL